MCFLSSFKDGVRESRAKLQRHLTDTSSKFHEINKQCDVTKIAHAFLGRMSNIKNWICLTFVAHKYKLLTFEIPKITTFGFKSQTMEFIYFKCVECAIWNRDRLDFRTAFWLIWTEIFYRNWKRKCFPAIYQDFCLNQGGVFHSRLASCQELWSRSRVRKLTNFYKAW